jgi:hypothetical protein
MTIRDEVQALVALGPLPESASATMDQMQQLQTAIEKISPPVTRDEATALLAVFGPDECYGLAWAVLHLIESTPGGIPLEKLPAETENEWIRFLWERSHR